eukprot:TRINITY_DN8277_c0_g1_i1.p1 TRINITY_DN8277_c0_g1~~TRINITY_DN8277_c0_g1_i1.p1  ORF type:complete len:298 (+),score=72.38 TRINITY_DN8277_c0_g1_i1:94-987(+)
MKQLESRLAATRMMDTVNVMIVSDHGVAHGQGYRGEVRLSDHLTEESCRWIVWKWGLMQVSTRGGSSGINAEYMGNLLKMLLLLSLILLVPGLQAAEKQKKQLILIVLDGFRWDYFQIYQERTGNQLEGFKKFMTAGVRTEYLESVFPAESFPAWQTLQTGVYPEVHGITGNQFYSPEVHEISKSIYLALFNIDDEETTGHHHYWQKGAEAEPIWVTAAKHNVTFATFLWGRCDVSYDPDKNLSPKYCENLYSSDQAWLSTNIDKALMQLQMGVDAAIIYESTLGKAGEDFGLFPIK